MNSKKMVEARGPATLAQITEAIEHGDGKSVLVVGSRGVGKSYMCEHVLANMDRHVVRWKPYEEFRVGRVHFATSQRGTVVFVDDADVMVKLSKGCSSALIQAIKSCSQIPGVVVLLTSCDDRGRVWKPVVDIIDTIIELLPKAKDASDIVVRSHKGKGTRTSWKSVLSFSRNAVASKQMRNWCDFTESEIDSDVTSSTSILKSNVHSDELNQNDGEEGSDVHQIAYLLVR